MFQYMLWGVNNDQSLCSVYWLWITVYRLCGIINDKLLYIALWGIIGYESSYCVAQRGPISDKAFHDDTMTTLSA